jgi:glycosyltransferase involved in cell wall biosynthesis
MQDNPDLLLLTWNRREYVQKTVENLLADSSSFRLFCWDNNSQDGTADIIASLKDPRIVKKHFHKENVRQRTPWLWFINEAAKSDLVGKLDDDILLPHGWTERIAVMLRKNPQFGTLACWIYMPEDWDEELAKHKIVNVNGCRVFQNPWVGGCSFLVRKELAKAYATCESTSGYGTPLNQGRMSKDGYVNGYPLPLMMAHHMDDPRSIHCRMAKTGIDEFSAATARARKFQSPEAYAKWIADDAKAILITPVADQHRRMFPSFLEQIKRKVARAFSKIGDKMR